MVVLFFTLLALWPMWRGESVRLWAIAVASIVLVFALVAPNALHFLNAVWTRLGVLMSKIASPVVLGAMFFFLFTPGAVLIRIMGKDLLQLRRSARDSYWARRMPPGPPPETIENQF
ncbi:MAG: SxtJ family membrane protein [Acidobacteria bacterium]|nr:SxtJ family membrane protein [Acidobacteriota bacterium]